MYGDAFLERYASVEEFPDLAHQYGFTWTILTPNDPHVPLLDHLAGWRRVFADNVAVIHVHDYKGPPTPRKAHHALAARSWPSWSQRSPAGRRRQTSLISQTKFVQNRTLSFMSSLLTSKQNKLFKYNMLQDLSIRTSSGQFRAHGSATGLTA